MSVETKIRQIITDNSNLSGDEIPIDAELLQTGLDSLDIATILLEVQEAFEITIPDDQEENLTTLNEIIKFVEQAQS